MSAFARQSTRSIAILRYFFYGTLLDADIRRRVLGHAMAPPGTPARLDGYVRVGVPGKSYPTLVAGPGSVHGQLFDGVTPALRQRLTAFEGTGYREAVLTVATDTGVETTARVLVARCPPRVITGWSLERWRRVDKARFMRGLDGAAPPPRSR